ncbi:DoxX protein [Chitinophaga sp. G-6-1-13]|uniref:DoxX protein n=1 Tax=Chitinophaga fulva TaxID=2728842 RepID=A0A848GJS7_9BACT|nr:DoxX protein [Chitinophaga fulva]NML38536.1 DoxX protein [Chitinophaga fulva]
MKSYQDIAALLLRLSLGTGFLSAVASRLGLWGSRSSGWQNFLQYTAQVNSFAPARIIPVIAVIATILEATLGLLLLAGFKTQLAAGTAMVLTLFFGAAMAYSFGLKEPLDYSVFAFSAGAFMLATLSNYRWSIDQLLNS